MKTFALAFFCSAFLLNNCLSQSFNYYYGNIHSQSSFSDGNKDSATSLITTPLQDFNYAKLSQHIDFYGISDHNHLSAGMNSPLHFHTGLAHANTANMDGSFVAMYGQEWGAISSGGHVIVYGYDSLMGWDASDYDVFVGQTNYAGLWAKINAKVGAFGYMAHPQSTDYNNLFITAVNASADNAIVGMAARSGPAFSTNNTYSNPSTSDYVARYQEALSLGYHIGVGLDHDTHNSVFGRQTAGRLVVLAPALTRANTLYAIRKMHMYSSDDWNVKVNFNINNQPMGSIYTHSTTPTLNVTVTDQDGESVSSIKVYYGVPGSGSLPTVLTSNTSSASLLYNHVIANNTTYYYYLEITQPDGDIIWTSPIWYTYNNGYTANAPVTNFSISSGNHCVGIPISVTDLSTFSPNAWNWTAIGATTNSSSIQNPSFTYTAPGVYSITAYPTNTTGGGLPLTQTISIVSSPTIVVSSASICSGQTATIAATGATTYSWNTGATISSITITPASTTIYTVTGTVGSCSKTNTTSVVVGAGPPVTTTSATICSGQTAVLNVSGATTYTWSTGSNATSVSVSPIATTIYTVTGTVGNCSKTNTTSVVVSAGPSVTATSVSICSGQTAVLNVSGATTYTWSTGGTGTSISVSPTSSSIYTVTGATSGCVNTVTTSVTVTSITPIVATSASICNGQTAILNASGATTYTWSSGANGNTISVSPSSTTIYSVTGSVSGCGNNTATTSVVVSNMPTVTTTSATICNGQTAVLNVSGATTYSWNTGATGSSLSVSPPSTTVYSVTGSVGGCSKTTSTTVLVNPSPIVTVSNPTTICAGQTATLISNGAATYSWSNGATTSNIIVTPTITSQYTVTGTTAGCSNSITTYVAVNNLPIVFINSSSATICVGQTATLTANGSASTYSWSTGANTSSIIVNPASTTTYTLMGLNTAGCKSSATIIEHVTVCTGINNVAGNSQTLIKVYPNPTYGILNINLGLAEVSETKIQLIDGLGKVLINLTTITNTIKLNLMDFENGIYLLKIICNNKTEIQKIIKY